MPSATTFSKSEGATVRAYVGLGSNVGDRAGNLWEAARRLNTTSDCRLVAFSDLYETEPVGPVEQAWFLNAVVALDTSISPIELLDRAKAIECEMGRQPTERWGPRSIDVDLLLFGEEQLETERLTLPHAELWNRRFVLVPLLDVLEEGPLAIQVQRRLSVLGETKAVRPYRHRI